MKKLFFVLLLIFVVHMAFRVFAYKEVYIEKFDPKYWESRYLHSQWVVPDSKESIGDDGLFMHAAWQYVHGADPFTIVPGYPPLGIYILGFSILIFQNASIFALLVGFLSLFLFYQLNLFFFNYNRTHALIPVLLFSFDPLFYDQLKAPYLDLLQLSFLFLTMLSFLKKKYIVSSIFLACFAAIKFPYLAVILVVCTILSLAIHRHKKELKAYLISLPVAAIIYILFYVRYFFLGHSFMEFVAGQKYMVNYYLIGAKAKFGIVYPMIFTGDWHTWWDGVVRIDEWNILWPIVFVTAVFAIVSIIKKREEKFTLIVLWVLFYLVFLSVIPVAPRYLLLLLPILYNLSVWVLAENIPHRFSSSSSSSR